MPAITKPAPSTQAGAELKRFIHRQYIAHLAGSSIGAKLTRLNRILDAARCETFGSSNKYRDTIFIKRSPGLTMIDDAEMQLLAQFRSEIRRFLQFSEQAAVSAGLKPQQHQLLLQIAGAPGDAVVTVGYIANAMGLRHHTTVELSKRCESAGLVRRVQSLDDRRCVTLELTNQGNRALRRLSEVHAQQLRELAPELIRALTAIQDLQV